MKEAVKPPVEGREDLGIPAPKLTLGTNYFIIDRDTGKVLERLSTSGKRVLRTKGLYEFKVQPEGDKETAGKRRLTDKDMVEGVSSGRLIVMSHEEILGALDRSKTGIGITGGGDCAGIADFLASLQHNLNPELTMLGVRNAGKGLKTKPEGFDEKLIIVDGLAADDFEGQSSTPYGSAREDPFPKKFDTDPGKRAKQEEEQANATENIRPFMFFYGTGGNDHLALLERIARRFPDKIVVGTFKSIDGDGWIAGRPAQMLGFNTAVRDYQRAVWAAAQNADTHNQWHVVETFGRGAGKLAYEAARRYPANFDELPAEERRKVTEYRRGIMILVPEKPTTFRSLAAEARAINSREGHIVVVAAEGFMPPELKYEMNRLVKDQGLKRKWLSRELKVEDIPGLVEVVDENDPRADLKKMLEDRELAAQFGKTIWESKLDPHDNVEKLAGIGRFIMQALEKLAGASKVNQLLENYEARGATPTEYDMIMGRKIGETMAKLVNDGVKGGKAVVYFEGMNPILEDPVVVDLVGVSDKNNLNNRELYPEEILQENGVFWKVEDLGRYLQAA
ncbi:MAG: 6-phosphofructokinase [Candidatus Altiarchaeota archaeon]